MRSGSRNVASLSVRQGVLAGLAVVGVAGSAAQGAVVTVDPAAASLGYMNVSDLPSAGGAYEFGSSWGTADLDAVYNGSVAVLTPNTSIDRDAPTDAYWWQNGGTGAGNKIMAASFYVENDALAGSPLTFTGLVRSNTLVSPYTAVAYIDDFSPGYALNGSVTVPLTPGVFSITLPATAAGDHIQYGFVTTGPDARLAAEAGLGSVQVSAVAAVPEPAGLAVVMAAAVPVVLRGRRARRPA